MKKIYLPILLVLFLPASLFASGVDKSAWNDNILSEKPDVSMIEELIPVKNPVTVSSIKVGDNGVTRVNDGHMLFKISGYSNSTIMKYVNSMGCTLPRRPVYFSRGFDIQENSRSMKTVNNGIYIKSGIEAEKGSGIYLLALGGMELDNGSSGANTQPSYSSGVFAGGGIGYFLKDYSMQVGYDNKVGATASFGILW